YDKVCRLEVLEVAWDQVRRSRGAAGGDGETIEAIEARGVLGFLLALREELISERYRPQAVRRVFIPKPDGRQRPLGIPGVKDRVAQAAVRIVIEPLFEASFRAGSYGFRPKRGAKQAIYDIRKWVTYGYDRVVDLDLKSYFDTISHGLLIKVVLRRVRGQRRGRLRRSGGARSEAADASRPPAELLLLLAVAAFDAAGAGQSEGDPGSQHASLAEREVGPTQSRSTGVVRLLELAQLRSA